MRLRDLTAYWRGLVLPLIAFASSAPCFAQAAYPEKPINLIVPFEAGALMDNFGRTLAQGLSARLGQPIVTINRPGASEAIGIESVVRAAPDGYTLLVSTQTGLVLNMAMRSAANYDSRKDLTPITTLFSSPLWLVTNPNVKAETVADLVALARSQPGKLSYASIGLGSTLHLAAELFMLRTGVEFLHVPYKGTSSAFLDLLSGRIDIMFSGSGTAIPQIIDGKLRALATTGASRSPVLPDIPAASEAGVSNYNVSTWLGLFGPRNMPASIVDKLNQEVAVVLNSEAIKRRAATDSLEIAHSTPEQLAERIRTEIPYWAEIGKQLNL
jgi:tripartite-type tricarboxylate transporter receptor subunit TctC